MEQQWTREPWEPWRDREHESAGFLRRVVPLTVDDYERARACVNACAGIADPAAELARLRAVAAAGRELAEAVEALQIPARAGDRIYDALRAFRAAGGE